MTEQRSQFLYVFTPGERPDLASDPGAWTDADDYTVTLKDDADDSTVATLQTDSATTSGNCLSELETAGAGTYYIEVVAGNEAGDSDPAQSAADTFTPSEPEPEPTTRRRFAAALLAG